MADLSGGDNSAETQVKSVLTLPVFDDRINFALTEKAVKRSKYQYGEISKWS